MGGIGGPPQQRRGADAEKKGADAAVAGAPACRASGGRRACNCGGEHTWGRRGADAEVVGAGYAWGRGGEWTMVYRALDHTIYLPTIIKQTFSRY